MSLELKSIFDSRIIRLHRDRLRRMHNLYCTTLSALSRPTPKAFGAGRVLI